MVPVARQPYRALQIIEDLAVDLDIDGPSVSQTKLLKAVREFGVYLAANTGRIPNYGERRHAGEAISTSFVESTVNQVISKRIWSKSSRCAGTPSVLICSCKSAPGSSTTPSPTTTGAGTPHFTHTTDQQKLAA